MDLSSSSSKIGILILGTIALSIFIVSLFALGKFRERYSTLPQRPPGLFKEDRFLGS